MTLLQLIASSDSSLTFVLGFGIVSPQSFPRLEYGVYFVIYLTEKDLLCLFIYCDAEFETQKLTHVKQVLSHWAISQPKLLSLNWVILNVWVFPQGGGR